MSIITRAWRVIPVLAVSAMLAVVLAVPAFAQDASDLVGPMKAGATTALTGGFAVAAILLVGYLVYRVIKRFAS